MSVMTTRPPECWIADTSDSRKRSSMRRLDDQAIDDQLDRVGFLAIDLRHVADFHQHAVDAGPQEAGLHECAKVLLVIAGLIVDQRREDENFASILLQGRADDLGQRVLEDRQVTVGAIANAEARIEKPQVIVDFRDRRQRAARPGLHRVLRDADDGGQAFDRVRVGALQLRKRARLSPRRVSKYRRRPSAKSVSNASELLPEPLGPVMTVKAPTRHIAV